MERREFFKRTALCAAAFAAVGSVPSFVRPPRLTLYGDGIHDDAPALQALFDGREVFEARTGQVIGGENEFLLTGGYYRLSRTIYMNQPGQAGRGHIRGAGFWTDGPHDEPAIRFGQPLAMSHNFALAD